MDKRDMLTAIVGIIFFLWFTIPFAAGIINIGNLTGAFLAVLLLGYGCFPVKVHLWIGKLWAQSAGRLVFTVLLLAAVVIGITAAAETVGMVRAVRKHPPKDTNVIVLGCSVKGTEPSRTLEERLLAAYDYLVKNPRAYAILSGGQGEDEDISEAECMYRYLTQRGIAPERLFCEDKSRTTEENLIFSKALLEEHGLSKEVTIVTSEFHAYRAAKAAERIGVKSYSTPSSTFFLYLPTYYVRELYGIIYYWMK